MLFYAILLWTTAIYGSYGYVIEGTVVVSPDAPHDWFVNTRINVDGGQYVGFVKSDGSFEVANVPSGSYMAARIDISSKGRIRARRVNAPQPNAVKELPYPLRLTSSGKAIYFKAREQLRTIDLLFNPNVLYVLVPFLLVMLLTKLVNTNDPELQKEMQELNFLNDQKQIPDINKLFSSLSLFGSSGTNTNSKKQTSAGSKRKTVEKTRPLSTSTSNAELDVGQSPNTSGNTHTSSSNRRTSKIKNQKYE